MEKLHEKLETGLTFCSRAEHQKLKGEKGETP
jgi:hypothetical protein